jgi:uncharacterized membrane protein YhhN
VALPFTPNQFFGVFAEYNRVFWPAVVILWLATAGAIAAAWRAPSTRSRPLTFVVAALWMWSAVAYHARLFTRINPTAWLFAALFVVEAALLMWAGFRRHIDYFSSTGWTRRIGNWLAVYALAYPFLAMAGGHPYPATPTFGVPCPTTIVTIAALLTAARGVPVWLTVIPALWALIGGSASFLLGVPTDYVLLASGFVLVVAVATRITQTPARPMAVRLVPSPPPADRLPT